MKQQRGINKKVRTVFGVASLAAGIAFAVEIENCGTNSVLSEGSSWAGGVAPGADDIAVWDGTGAAASGGWSHVLGAEASWYGLRTTNCIENLAITNAGSETLTLGAGGITLGAKNSYLSVPLIVAADQTWNISGAVDIWTALYVQGQVTGSETLTLDGEYLVFQQPVQIPHLTVNNETCFLRNNATLSFPVTINQGKTLCWHLANGDWADVMGSSLTSQNGILKFGHGFAPVVTATLHAGDLIAGQGSSSRENGRIQVENGHLQNDGGTISNNWLYFKNGSFTQSAGTTWMKNGIYAGFGNNTYQLETGSVFLVTSGEVDAWEMTIGLATTEAYPGLLEISGGDVSFLRFENTRLGGIELAVKADYNMNMGQFLMGDSPSGILRMSGGTLNTSQLSFGKLVNNMVVGDTSISVTDGYAAVSLSGGTMNIGALGFGPSAAWNATTNASVSPSAWYDVRMSGGTLGALESFTNRARVRLGDENGGLTVRAETPSGAACNIAMAEPLIGPGGLTKTGAGGLYLNTANTYAGRTRVAEGTLYLNSRAAEPEPPVALPPATATWVADSLGLTAGAPVTAWQATNTAHSFTLTVAKAIISSSTAPHIATIAMNGHAAVAFDGASNALALTGLNATPVADATNMTVALVMRSDAPGKGTVSSSAFGNVILLGQTAAEVNKNRWRIGYTANGRLGFSIMTNMPAYTCSAAWASPRDLGDGDPHVLVFTWATKGAVTACVDGFFQSSPDLSGVVLLSPMRMILGTSEAGNVFRGEIAEFRFYKNTALTEAQQRALGRVLAQTYGAETAGYLTETEKANASLPSREILIAAGATLDTGDGGMNVTNGQVILGTGAVSGTLRICDGGVLASTNASAALTVSDLVLQSGGTVRWRYDSAGTAPEIQTGDLTLPNGTVTVALASDLETPEPFGTLLTYTGSLTDNGVVWNVAGGHRATCVEIDTTLKAVRITTKTGTLIRLY